MKVVALEYQPSSKLGGQELNLFEICRGLSERGHQIELMYVQKGDLLEKYAPFCDALTQVNGYFPTSAGRSSKKPDAIAKFGLGASKDLLKIPPMSPGTIIFCNDFTSVMFGRLLSIFKQAPLIHYIQIPGVPFKYKQRFGTSGVNRFIAVSQQTKTSWVDIGIPAEKVSVVYNGIDTKTFFPIANVSDVRDRFGIPANHKVISYIGRITPEKGIDVLIRAFAKVVKTRSDVELLIAGKANDESGEAYLKRLHDLAEELGVAQSVRFIGHLSNTVDFYRASDVVVVPSVWAEPCPRVVLEAMGCGTPLLASNTGGLPELLGARFKDWLFEPGDSDALAEKIGSLCDWRTHTPRLQRDCHAYIKEYFSSTSMIDGIEAILLREVEKYRHVDTAPPTREPVAAHWPQK